MDHNIIIDSKVPFSELNLLEETKSMLDLISDKFWKQNGIKVRIEDIFNKAE